MTLPRPKSVPPKKKRPTCKDCDDTGQDGYGGPCRTCNSVKRKRYLKGLI